MSYGRYTYGVPKLEWANKDATLIVKNFCSIGSNVTIF